MPSRSSSRPSRKSADSWARSRLSGDFSAASKEIASRTCSPPQKKNLHGGPTSPSAEPRSPLSPKTISSETETAATTHNMDKAAHSADLGLAVPSLQGKTSDEENNHNIFLQHSLSSEATPDPDTLLDVQAFIDNVHNHRNRPHDEGSTMPESHSSHPQAAPRLLHLVQSHDSHDELVVEPAVVASIGEYIDTLQQQEKKRKQEGRTTDLTAVPSSSQSWDHHEVSPEMLALVRQWIEHLPPKSPAGAAAATTATATTGHSSFDTMEVDPDTMAAVEACMELVTEEKFKTKDTATTRTKTNRRLGKLHSFGSNTTKAFGMHHLHQVPSIVVGTATVTENAEVSSTMGCTVASATVASDGTVDDVGESKHDEEGGERTDEENLDDFVDIPPVDSGLSDYATRSRVTYRTYSEDGGSMATDCAITSLVSAPTVVSQPPTQASVDVSDRKSVVSNANIDHANRSSAGRSGRSSRSKPLGPRLSHSRRAEPEEEDAATEQPPTPSPKSRSSHGKISKKSSLGNEPPEAPSTALNTCQNIATEDATATSSVGVLVQDMVVPNVATFQSAGVFSQNSIEHQNLAAVPSYRSYGGESSSDDSTQLSLMKTGTKPSPTKAVATAPSYRSCGGGSCSDDSKRLSSKKTGLKPSPTPAKAFPTQTPAEVQESLNDYGKLVIRRNPTAQTMTSDAATSSVAGRGSLAEDCSLISSRNPKLVIKRAETAKTHESDFVSKQEDLPDQSMRFSEIASINSVAASDDSGTKLKAESGMEHVRSVQSGFSSGLSGSVDERIRHLIDAVEGWGGEGSFIDYTGGASIDSKTLEALEALVADAESCSVEDRSSTDESSIPEALGEELRGFLDAIQFKKHGESIVLPTSFRVKKDPPASDEVRREPKDDPPITNTLSRELSRWNSGNDHPEPNPEKRSFSTGDSSHLDPEHNKSLMPALSGELLDKKRAAQRTASYPDVAPRPPSLTPDFSNDSVQTDGKSHPTHLSRMSDSSTASPIVHSPTTRKFEPPRPEDSRLSRKQYDEEKKEDPLFPDVKSTKSPDLSRGSVGASEGNSTAASRVFPPDDSEDTTKSDSLGPRGRDVAKSFGSFSGDDTSSSDKNNVALLSDPIFKSDAFEQICELLDDPTSSCERLALVHLIRVVYAETKHGKSSIISYQFFEGLSLEVVNSFLDAVALSQKKNGEMHTMKTAKAKSRNYREEEEVLDFVEQIAVIVRSGELFGDDPIPVDFIDGPTDSEANGIEYDINSGFVRQEHAAQDPEGETPWWEATAKIAVASMDILDGVSEPESTSGEDTNTATNTDSSRTTSQSTDKKEPGTVDEDIDAFWKSQRDIRERRMQFRGSKRRERAVEPPDLNIASYSNSFASQNTGTFLSQNTGTFLSQNTGNSGSFSKTTVESLDTLEERWLLKRSMAGYGQWRKPQQWLASKKETVLVVDDPEPINGVQASQGIHDISMRWREQRDAIFSSGWILPYEKRCEKHTGFQGIDFYSLRDSSKVPGTKARAHRLDSLPWEKREVKQYFMYEQSVVSRNWFGRFKRYSSVTIHMPVCRPRSMEMPVKAPEWTEDWYRAPLLRSLGTNPSESTDGEAAEYYRKYVQSEDESEEEEGWEDTPECGTLKNVKLKPGERISRVTPELTSSLRRSRWRKKFFPKGTFPY